MGREVAPQLGGQPSLGLWLMKQHADYATAAYLCAGFGISPHDIQVPGPPPRGTFVPFGAPHLDDRQHGARPGPQGPMQGVCQAEKCGGPGCVSVCCLSMLTLFMLGLWAQAGWLAHCAPSTLLILAPDTPLIKQTSNSALFAGCAGMPSHWRPPSQPAPGPSHPGGRPSQFSRAPGPPPGKVLCWCRLLPAGSACCPTSASAAMQSHHVCAHCRCCPVRFPPHRYLPAWLPHSSPPVLLRPVQGGNSGGGGNRQQGGGGLFDYSATPPLMMQAPFLLQPPPFMHPQQPGSPWAAAMMASAQQVGGGGSVGWETAPCASFGASLHGLLVGQAGSIEAASAAASVTVLVWCLRCVCRVAGGTERACQGLAAGVLSPWACLALTQRLGPATT